MVKLKSNIFAVSLIFSCFIPCFRGFTDDRDAAAINFLYISLGSPLLAGWRIGGDPCAEAWQGVLCVNSNITAITLREANLNGQLTDNMGNFSSIITIDLSGNHISGSIPENLPVTLRKLVLGNNQFTGPIPDSISNLSLLTDLLLGNNLLQGQIPDSFQTLTGLINMDISFNNLSGQLPPSMSSLSSLVSCHMQNNQLTGVLDVLQDLPLQDLNIENNLFNGPIPQNLLTIPNFVKDGNPFNISSPPLPAPSLPPSPLPEPPSSDAAPSSRISIPPLETKGKSILSIGIYVAIGLALVIIVVLLLCICIRRSRRRSKEKEELPVAKKVKSVSSENLIIQNNDIGRESPKDKEHQINMISLAEEDTVTNVPVKIKSMNIPISSFSIADLQQYTNSFGKENLISKNKLGNIYLAELPDRKLLTVMNVSNAVKGITNDQFIKLVSGVSELKHSNVLDIVGYCAEYDQRLLIYSYFSTRTLHDILHSGENNDVKDKLSWNARVQIAYGAAKALEYLHEGCRPPVIHGCFESANILVNDEFSVRVSECGLAPLISLDSTAKAQGLHSCAAPELSENWTCTDKSDVYSFGVVMLELLTGRTPYNRSRPIEERYLVQWASSELYDLDALSRIVDPSIEGKFSMKSLSWFADIISRCIQNQPEFRPPISEIVLDLNRMIEKMRE